MSGWRTNSNAGFFGGKDPLLLFLLATICVLALLFSIDLTPPRFRGRELKPRTDLADGTVSQPTDQTYTSRNLNAETLSIAFAPVISPEASFEEYQVFAAYLGKALGLRTKLIQSSTYAETNNLVRFGACQLAFVCSYAFVRGEKEFGMLPLAVPVINGSTYYQSFVIVPAPSDAHSLLDLRGQTFVSADMLSTSGWLYPALWLLRRGVQAEEFFPDRLLIGSHDRAIRAVAEGIAGAGAVDGIVYYRMLGKNSGLKDKVRIIQESPHYGMPPIVSSRATEPGLRQRLQDTLLAMEHNPSGRRVLLVLGFDRFAKPEPGSYDSVRKGVEEWEAQF